MDLGFHGSRYYIHKYLSCDYDHGTNLIVNLNLAPACMNRPPRPDITLMSIPQQLLKNMIMADFCFVKCTSGGPGGMYGLDGQCFSRRIANCIVPNFSIYDYFRNH